MPTPPTPRPSRDLLEQVLAEARQGPYSRRAAAAHLQRYLAQWFPPQQWATVYAAAARPDPRGTAREANLYHRFCRDPPRVSREWAAALQLLELARLVDAAPPRKPSRPASTRSEGAAVAQTAEHLLRYAVLPPAGWAVTLRLLHEWRAASHRPAAPSAFPPALSPPAAAQLLHHISLAAPSPQAWQEALELYQRCAAQTHRAVEPSSASSGASAAPPAAAAANTAFLKALRHMTLTTLLQAGEWARGLHFYYHTLYQRDLPGTITTAYLVQQLGRAGQWASVLRVYELCVKLLRARREQAPASVRPSDDAAARQWGTTLSMAMAAAQRSPGAPPGTLAAMLRQLLPDEGAAVASAACASPPPLVLLDGHFLSAVQALPSEPARLAVLQLAQRGCMLDVFKLIRGLACRQRWEEALLLFERAMASAPTPSSGAPPPPCLSRREVGEARLHLLHGCTLDSVASVVAALNRHRRPAAIPPRGGAATTAQSSVRLRLNDREVECVLSKALTLTGGGGAAPPAPPAALARRLHFWQYCLEVLASNYGTPPSTRGPAPAPRRPTPAALSFLLRHPRLPWDAALDVVQRYGLLEVPHGAPADPRRRRPEAAPASPTPRALALAAAVELLRSHGQTAEAERLALRALEVEAAERGPGARTADVALSAALLQAVQYSTLCDLLRARRGSEVQVAAPTLFHLLHESTRGGGTDRRQVARDSDAAFFDQPCGRALTVLWLLMLQRHSKPFAPPATVAEVPASLFCSAAPPARASCAVSWLLTYPVAVHCEVVRVVQCATAPPVCSRGARRQAYARLWTWTLRYLGALATHFAELHDGATGGQSGTEAASTAAAACERYYGATFEAVLALLDSAAPAAKAGPPDEPALDVTCTGEEKDGDVPQTSAQRVGRLCQLLERAVSRYGCLPPTHMLLPNQLDRLLPPLARPDSAGTATNGAPAAAHHDRPDAQAERCAVAVQLVRLVVAALARRRRHRGPPVVEPVLLHNLLKLCCRLAEYDEASGVVTHASHGDVSGELSRSGASLVRLQCEVCGLHTVRPGTLSLLYCLCAAAQSRATRCGHDAPRQAALEATRYLLERQPPTTRHVVLARHCRQYLSLFGWEAALETWYRAFPREVLSELAHVPQAVEACLSLGERDTR